MLKSKNEQLKDLIIKSNSVDAADRIIEKNYGFATVEEKIAFLRGMFDVDIELDYSKKIQSYYSLLTAIFAKYSNWFFKSG